jgi:hypothetical protein
VKCIIVDLLTETAYYADKHDKVNFDFFALIEY